MTQVPGDAAAPPDPAGVVWRDGRLIPWAEATVHVLSHAANRGSEVFDVLRVLPGPGGGGAPVAVGLRPHVARFEHSMALMGMASPWDIGTLERAVAETVAANPGPADRLVKLVAAWAEVPPATVPTSLVPVVFVACAPIASPGVLADQPARLRSVPGGRIPADVLPTTLKVAALYTAAVRLQLAARADGYDDVLLRTADGDLAEAPSQSLLVVTDDGHLLAPPLDSVLDGVTRRLVLDLALDRGLAVDVRSIRWDEVTGAAELLLVSTSRFIRPVAELDDVAYPAPGPVAAQLGADLDALVGGRHRLSGRWLTPL
ncbi:MAG: aminotransferase class IV [Acidimicrobiales bacterium]